MYCIVHNILTYTYYNYLLAEKHPPQESRFDVDKGRSVTKLPSGQMQFRDVQQMLINLSWCTRQFCRLLFLLHPHSFSPLSLSFSLSPEGAVGDLAVL